MFEDGEVDWNGTLILEGRIKDDLRYEEKETGDEKLGFFLGHRIISRDAPINKGIYLGSSVREAIVVDDQENPDELKEVYDELLTRMSLGVASENNKGIPEYILETVLDRLDGSRSPGNQDHQSRKVAPEVSDMVTNHLLKNGPDSPISLNEFIKKGVGVCRHRSLLAGYLIERLIKEGFLRGKVSIDRNYIKSKGGHSWARWTRSMGGVIIIDPALGFAGPIEQSEREFWDYRRPNEK